VREGVVAGLEPFIDTCLVCTLTALVILATGTWNRGPSGDFAGDIQLVRAEGPGDGSPRWSVQADTDLANLPTLPAPDSWEAGNGFFLLARVPGGLHADQKSSIVKITGTIESQAAADPERQTSTRTIRWDDISLDTSQWEQVPDDLALELVDKGIYRDFTGAALTGHAFDRAIPGLGKYLVTLACWLFAISTLISWSYYGEQGIIFLFGTWAVPLYKVVFCGAAIVASFPWFIKTDAELGNLADLGTGVMLFANVPIIVAMGYQAISAISDYFRRIKSGQIRPPHEAPPIVDVVEGRDVE
jgi:AGCS family alanine or glycine:cation symporter